MDIIYFRFLKALRYLSSAFLVLFYYFKNKYINFYNFNKDESEKTIIKEYIASNDLEIRIQ